MILRVGVGSGPEGRWPRGRESSAMRAPGTQTPQLSPGW